MKSKLTGLVACASVALFATSSALASLNLTPTGPGLAGSGPETSQTAINTAINLIVPGLSGTEVYKQDVGGGESGAAAGSYTTVINGDASGGTISQNVGAAVTIVATHLLVKDGAQNPGWYLFNISTWNGMVDIVLSGFWPGNGAISHISIYGGTTPIPEPTSIGLFALGMSCVIGGSFARRRRLN